jgi:putative intracellular protease/amidase
MDRREFNTALAVASLTGLFASSAQAQQPPPKRAVVGMLVYSDMILLDLSGPLTVFNIMQADIHLVAKTKQPVTTDVGLPVTPTDTFATAPAAYDACRAVSRAH